MIQGNEIDEVLDFIRSSMGIPNGDEPFEKELAGIRIELERLQKMNVLLSISRDEEWKQLEPGEPVDAVEESRV